MNYKLVLKTYAQLRQLTDDETALLNTLRGMNDAERELLAETLGPVVAKKKPTTTRVIEHCVADVNGAACTLTRRAQVHKDSSVKDYHEFQPQVQLPDKKSRRASSLAGAIKKKSGDKEPRCVACYEIESHSNHDLANGGHEFEASVSARAVKTLEKYESDDGDTCTFEGCTRPADDNVHHLATHSYYHEFQPATAQSASGG